MCEWFAKKSMKTVKVTHISPSHGSVRGGTKVTVTGSGFLPIAGADMALIGTRAGARPVLEHHEVRRRDAEARGRDREHQDLGRGLRVQQGRPR